MRAAPPLNPYITGKVIAGPRGFFGREDVFDLVQAELQQPERNAIVLFGQRRIGKTSILLNLQARLTSPPFVTVYMDLMDKARRPLGEVLRELAADIAIAARMPPPDALAFDNAGASFRGVFLPLVYAALGGQRLVLLFDEFDVLDVQQEEKLPEFAAARAFFPYLRELMSNEPRLGFVFVVGRKAEELGIDFKSAFKASRYYRVSVLDRASCRSLITRVEGDGTLRYADGAVERILDLTACHPYFTQLLCSLVFEQAWSRRESDAAPGAVSPPTFGPPVIGPADVEAAIPRALEAGENIFQWIWDGLPPAERVIFSAVAAGTHEQSVLSEDRLLDTLQRQGIRILIRELEVAPRTLIEWQMLREREGGYQFFIELMRRWVADRKPLATVKDELDRINPLADTLFQAANGFYRRGRLGEAVAQLQSALSVNPNHTKARLLLGEVHRAQGDLDAAVLELTEAGKLDDLAARGPLEATLLQRAAVRERDGKRDDAYADFQRVLAASPANRVARERVAEIDRLREAARLDQLRAQAADYEAREQWDDARTIYARLGELRPGDAAIADALARLTREADLQRLYLEGAGLAQQQQWRPAARALAELDRQRRPYKDVAELLSRARQEVALLDTLEQAAQAADGHDWEKARAIAGSILAARPEQAEAIALVARSSREMDLARRYAEGVSALGQNQWAQAKAALAGVVALQPYYLDARDLLQRATGELAAALSSQQALRASSMRFAFDWTLAGISGALVALVLAPLFELVIPLPLASDAYWMAIFGLLFMGAAIAAGEIVQARLLGARGIRALAWFAGSAAGLAVAVGIVVASGLRTETLIPGAVLGLLVTWIAQWRLCLKTRFGSPLREWLVARALGAAAGTVIGLAAANAVANLRPNYGSLLLSGIALGVTHYALISSVLASVVLARLLRLEARAQAGLPATPARPFSAYPRYRALRLAGAVLLSLVIVAGLIRSLAQPQPANALVNWTPDPNRTVFQAAFRPGRTGLPAGEYHVATVSGPDVRLWRVNVLSNTATLMSSVGTQGDAQRLAFDPTGALLAVADYQGLKLLEIDASGRVVSDQALRSDLIKTTSADVTFSQDGKVIGLGYDHTVALVGVDPLTLTRQIINTPTYVKRLAFDPDKTHVIVRYDNGIGVYDLAGSFVISGVYYGNQNDIPYIPGDLIVLSNGYGLAAYRDDASAAWSVEYAHSGAFDRSDVAVLTVATSPDGKYIASGTNQGEVWLASAVDGRRLAVYRGHLGYVHSLDFSPDGKLLLSAGEDGRVLVWKLP